jgi:hypothetical protein
MFDIDVAADVNENSRAKIHFGAARASAARPALVAARRLLRAAARPCAARRGL